jgi:hypothetical protein
MILIRVVFVQDLKQWILAQYSTHFQELQTIVSVKKSLAEISVRSSFGLFSFNVHACRGLYRIMKNNDMLFVYFFCRN